MIVFIVRHGETKLNEQGRLRGWIDVPLNEKGLEEAHEIADFFKGKPIQRIFSADLKRAQKTAEIIGSEHLYLVPHERSNFRPINWGELNGKKWDDIKDEVEEWIERWKVNPSAKIPEGESFAEFQERNLVGLREAVKGIDDDKAIIIVTSLRNCLLFRGYAKNDSVPLRGDDIEIITEMDHDTGNATQYRYEEGRLIYVRHVDGEGAKMWKEPGKQAS